MYFCSLIRLGFLFLICSASLFAKYDVSVCAIFQNEAPYFKEWIEFHKLQGVQHFYLYNNLSEDDYLKELEPYIQKNEVTLVQWPHEYDYKNHAQWIRIQSGAYKHCVRNFGDETKWLAAIDIDEFLFCPTGKKLPRFLRKFKEFGGLCINWLQFGTSNVEDIPEGKALIEILTHCADHTNRINSTIKTIVQPKYVKSCRSAHFFSFIDGKHAVNADKMKQKGDSMHSKDILLDEIRINHYWSRTEKYMREVKIPSRQKRRDKFPPERMYQMAESYNVATDEAILQFLPKLREALGYSESEE